jgi:DNA-binding NarL/FixJ family response regulator
VGVDAGIRILLADDHVLVRASLRYLLEGFDGFDIVGEASDGYETVKKVDELRPDIVIMDISMPGLNGVEAARLITKQNRATRVVILSMHSDETHVLQALRAGASAYVLKESAPSELDAAIRAVARGESFLSPAISRQVIDDYLKRVPPESGSPDLLTPRQRETLRLIAEGKTSKEIARHLGASVKTVESHRASLMDRLDIHDVAGLVRYAVRHGLVSSER